MTGARMPECGYDSVVRLEDVKIERDGERIVAISLVRPVQLGANVRYVGEDFKIGQRIVSPGTRLGPQHILGLATLGHHTIEVSVRPRVVGIYTGDELVGCSEAELGPSQIRNSTAPLLKSILEGYGAEVVACDVASDRREGVRAALERAIVACPDLVVTTGGVSVGKFDLVEDVLRELGAQIFFHKVAVRPGKPILFGELPTPGNVLVGSGQALICFGLPGNPIAVAAGARFFVLPFLRALLGGSLEVAHRLPILEQASKPGGLVFFQRGVRFGQGVKALNGQASFMTSSLMEAEGWIVSHSEGPVIAKGELVEWYPLWS